MTTEPPDWGADPLSQYFRDAEFNDRVTAARYPPVFELLQQVHSAFAAAEAAFEKDGVERAVPRFLFIRSHSSFLAACRLAMSGQLPEAYAVLRAGLEQAWYGLHIERDPKSPSRLEVWLRRNESPDALARCKAEFTVKNVCDTHAALDSGTAADLKAVYADLIDFGAHPNQLGILAAAHSAKGGSGAEYSIGILYPEELPVLLSLKMAAAVGIGALKLLRLVYPERFKIMGLDTEVDRLVERLNPVFKPYQPKA